MYMHYDGYEAGISPESMAVKSAEWLKLKLEAAGFTVTLEAEPVGNTQVGNLFATREFFKGGAHRVVINFSAHVSAGRAIGSVVVALKGMGWGSEPAPLHPIDLENADHRKMMLLYADDIELGLQAIKPALDIDDLIGSKGKQITVNVRPE